MEDFRWKGISPAVKMGKNNNATSWDWLVDGLDIGRVRSTLSQFPIRERVSAGPISDIEVWLKTDDDTDDSFSVDTSSEPSVDSVREMSEPVDDVIRVESIIAETDDWQGVGPDQRYNPAFLLPFILGALESSLSRAGSSLNALKMSPKAYRGDEENEFSLKEYVMLAQRLSDKGALSLAIASLSSDCLSLRKVAVATLGHMKAAIDSDEARKLSSWRERPQLAMIIDSVQRGLTVRLAMRLDPKNTSSRLLVPKLPVLSAVFLARASLIIVKSSDPMFGQINKYFLRLEHGHGAFKDTNRLPAFISLFCSSADEPGQARRERIWALQLLKDSFVETYCYRMIASCHATELLLTSFASIATRQEDEQPDFERILLLETITSLLHFGGRRATAHLIGRVGLLSWLRGQLALDVLPSLESRIAFLRLMLKSIESARSYLAEETSDRAHLLSESRPLINGVVMLHYDSINDRLQSAQRYGNSIWDSFATASCETLRALVEITHELGFPDEVDEIQQVGIPLASALKILQTVPVSLVRTAVWSLCNAPVGNDGHAADNSAAFISFLLTFLAEHDTDAALSTAVLRRVSCVASLNAQPYGSDCGLLRTLLACRSKCLCASDKSRQAWFECLKVVTERTLPTESEDLCVARAIINGSQRSVHG